MSPLRVAESILVFGALVGLVFSAFWLVEERHASKREELTREIQIRSELLGQDIKSRAEAAHYYRSLKAGRELEPAEQARLEYLERSLERLYDQEERLEERKLSDG